MLRVIRPDGRDPRSQFGSEAFAFPKLRSFCQQRINRCVQYVCSSCLLEAKLKGRDIWPQRLAKGRTFGMPKEKLETDLKAG
jgi:hypothetical protein